MVIYKILLYVVVGALMLAIGLASAGSSILVEPVNSSNTAAGFLVSINMTSLPNQFSLESGNTVTFQVVGASLITVSSQAGVSQFAGNALYTISAPKSIQQRLNRTINCFNNGNAYSNSTFNFTVNCAKPINATLSINLTPNSSRTGSYSPQANVTFRYNINIVKHDATTFLVPGQTAQDPFSGDNYSVNGITETENVNVGFGLFAFSNTTNDITIKVNAQGPTVNQIVGNELVDDEIANALAYINCTQNGVVNFWDNTTHRTVPVCISFKNNTNNPFLQMFQGISLQNRTILGLGQAWQYSYIESNSSAYFWHAKYTNESKVAGSIAQNFSNYKTNVQQGGPYADIITIGVIGIMIMICALAIIVVWARRLRPERRQ